MIMKIVNQHFYLYLQEKNIERDYIKEVDLLLRSNIIKRNNWGLQIASPFIKKLLLYFISNEETITLDKLPLNNRNLIDIPFLIEKIIENMNILNLITAEKLFSNTMISTEIN